MGNVEAHDFAPVRADERNVLNLSRKVTPKQYVRHLNGQPHDACLTELPWNIRDSVCLYEKMTVAFNAITEIPVELPLRLPHLSCLHLDHNQITALPESFGLFFHLKEIQLQHNKLASLPESFVHLVKLEKIDLSYNELRSLPVDMGNMESLRKLNVIHNKLVELPASLGSPSCHLKVLLAQQNRLEKPSQAICEEGSLSTLQCLRKMYASLKPEVKPPPVNVFPRCCGNRSESGVSNPHSAQIQYMQQQTNTLHTTNRIKAPLLPPPDASSHSPFVLQDKIIGLIYGAAVGDAIGVSCQWMTDDEVSFHYGNDDEDLEYERIVQDEYRVLWRQGDWTSNFDQFMLVLDSLVSWGGVVDELEFARRLKGWAGHGFPELGDSVGVITSPVVQKVISHASFTQDPHSVASLVLEENVPVPPTPPPSLSSSSSPLPPSSPSSPLPPRPQPSSSQPLSLINGHEETFITSTSIQETSPILPPTTDHYHHHRLRRLSSSSSCLPSLSMYSHVEVAQRLVDCTPSVLACQFGEDGIALLRSPVLGLANFHEPYEVEGNTVRICRTTHAHPRCLASCLVVSAIVSTLLQGDQSDSSVEPSDQLDDIFTRAAVHLKDATDREEFCSLKEIANLSSFDAREPGRLRHCYKLVQIAVIAFKWGGDFKSLISCLTRMGGDSSSNGCLAGAVMGCRAGYSNLPGLWLAGLRPRQVAWLNAKINHLLDVMGSP